MWSTSSLCTEGFAFSMMAELRSSSGCRMLIKLFLVYFSSFCPVFFCLLATGCLGIVVDPSRAKNF